MRIGLIISCTFCFTFSIFGQGEIVVSEIDDSRLIEVMNNSRLIGENRDNSLSVRVYKIDNGSGSAGIPEGHEVTYNLLIAVSEYDEYPKQNLFEIGSFINPEFVKWNEGGNNPKVFEIECGLYNKRELVLLNVDVSKLKINKSQ